VRKEILTRRQGSGKGLAGQGQQGPGAGWLRGTCRRRVSLGCRRTMRRPGQILPGELGAQEVRPKKSVADWNKTAATELILGFIFLVLQYEWHK